MLRIELVPDFSHCIETVVKGEYNETLQQLLASSQGRNQELREKAELLRTFLEFTDFKRLRQESEKSLIEGKTVKFVLSLESEGLKCYMQVI